ncbi:MAG: carboxyl transferase domain-containing protein, partial [Planctomycetota bacterium]
VITCAAGFPTTVTPILQNGCIPVFLDNDPVTGNLRVDQLEQAYVPGRTKAVISSASYTYPLTDQLNLTGSFGYKAGPGYDMATGLGSIDANALVTGWNKATKGVLLTLLADPGSRTLNDSVQLTATVISADGIPQIAAIMGNCVAGGGYLPVLCDTLLMTEGSGLYLAGPALVKAAIGQTVSHEDLGGAAMHAAISGTIDFREANDPACLERLRRLVDTLPADQPHVRFDLASAQPTNEILKAAGLNPASKPSASRPEYEVRDVLACVLDAAPFDEYKAEYGKSLVCGFGRLGGVAVGVVANQRKRSKPAVGPVQIGGVIYADAADKAARFIMDCNQSRTPILFFQDVSGFMVGRDSEHEGVIRSGAKLVNAISNSVVPKITVILGGSFGAGNYALCGKAFDPRFIFAWPNAKYAVMGGEAAASTLLDITVSALKRTGHEPEANELTDLRDKVRASYEQQTDVRYAAARMWVDAIIEPEATRQVLLEALAVSLRYDDGRAFKAGVFQV